jgi:hypothetical protein
VAAGAGALASAVVVLPHALLFHDGLGVTGLPVGTALLALVVLPFAPLYPRVPARSGILAVVLGVTLGSLTVATTRRPYGESSRRPLNLVRLEDATAGQALFVAEGSAGPLPPALAEAADWQWRSPLPWAPRLHAFAAPAPPAHLAGPRLVVVSEGERDRRHRFHLRLSPGSGGDRGGLSFPDAQRVAAISVEGWQLDPALCTLSSGWLRVALPTLPPGGVTVELAVRGGEPLAAVLDEQIRGLPGDAAALATARGPLATPVHDGDRTVVIRGVDIP